MYHRKREHLFSFCPRCGGEDLRYNGISRFSCASCDFVFYQNTAAACGAILTVGDRSGAGPILLLRRGREPAQGKLDFPGGFVDPGESVEAALAREIREEIGTEARDLRYFTSAPNQYPYGGVLYHTCDLVFTGTISEPPQVLEEAEIAGFVLLSPTKIRLEEIAFPSLRRAMELYLSDIIDHR